MTLPTLRAPIEFRFPFFDLRLVCYILRLPAIRWCAQKEILRSAMIGRIPEEVRRRPKAPSSVVPNTRFAPWATQMRKPGAWLSRYIDFTQIESLVPENSGCGVAPPTLSRLFAINFWLEKSVEQTVHPSKN